MIYSFELPLRSGESVSSLFNFRRNTMTEIKARCNRHRKVEEVTEMEVLNDGLLLTFECGQTSKVFFSA